MFVLSDMALMLMKCRVPLVELPYGVYAFDVTAIHPPGEMARPAPKIDAVPNLGMLCARYLERQLRDRSKSDFNIQVSAYVDKSAQSGSIRHDVLKQDSNT